MNIIQVRYSPLGQIMKQTHLQNVTHVNLAIKGAKHITDNRRAITMLGDTLLPAPQKMKTAPRGFVENTDLKKKIDYIFQIRHIICSSLSANPQSFCGRQITK